MENKSEYTQPPAAASTVLVGSTVLELLETEHTVGSRKEMLMPCTFHVMNVLD